MEKRYEEQRDEKGTKKKQENNWKQIPWPEKSSKFSDWKVHQCPAGEKKHGDTCWWNFGIPKIPMILKTSREQQRIFQKYHTSQRRWEVGTE